MRTEYAYGYLRLALSRHDDMHGTIHPYPYTYTYVLNSFP